MRKFKESIFLGNGDFSKLEVIKAHERLKEGFDILGGLQQPHHSTGDAELDASIKKENRYWKRELLNVVRDIAVALTGKEIKFR